MEQLAAPLVDELLAIRRENQTQQSPQQSPQQLEQPKVEGSEQETKVKQQSAAKEEHGKEAATAVAAAAAAAASPSSVRPPRRRRSRRRVKAKDTVIIQYEVSASCRKLKAASWLHWMADGNKKSASSWG